MSKDLASPVIKKTAIDENGIAHYLVEGGMTKREVIAMHAMQGYLANTVSQVASDFGREEIAQTARLMADALLKELSR